MTLGQKLKSIRTENKLTMEELKNLLNRKYDLNISKSMISRWENEKSEPLNTYLSAYAKEFDLDLNELLGIEPFKPEKPKHIKDVTYKTINVYGLVPAGIPLEAIEEILDTEDISFQDGYSPYEEYMGLRVDGDSMYPKYLDGDTIIIEVTPDCENGEDCVVYVNGYDATLKTVIKNDNGTITLKPINPEYPPRTYNPKEEEIRILGKVKELRRRI